LLNATDYAIDTYFACSIVDILTTEINELRPLLLRMLRDADGFAFSQEEGGSVTQTDVIRAYDTNLPKPGGM